MRRAVVSFLLRKPVIKVKVIKDFHFSLFDNTLDYFGNTFVTHMDDFAIHQIYNLLSNSYLQKEHLKGE